MSKIGKISIEIPEKVKVSLEGKILKMEGPLGKNSLSIDETIFDLDIKEGKSTVAVDYYKEILINKIEDYFESLITSLRGDDAKVREIIKGSLFKNFI